MSNKWLYTEKFYLFTIYLHEGSANLKIPTSHDSTVVQAIKLGLEFKHLSPPKKQQQKIKPDVQSTDKSKHL